MSRTALSLIVSTVAVGAAAVGVPAAQAHPRNHDFEAELHAVNHGGHGEVDLKQFKNKLRVKLQAEGLDGGIHLAHLHGLQQAQNECPDATFDVDHNGFVDIAEGLPAYGPVQITLSNGLSDVGSDLKYRRTVATLDSGESIASLGKLDRYAIVVHGVDLDGDGLATNPNAGNDSTSDQDDNEISMPALCGTIEVD